MEKIVKDVSIVLLLIVVVVLGSLLYIQGDRGHGQTLTGVKALAMLYGRETITVHAAIDAIRNGNSSIAVTQLENEMTVDLVAMRAIESELVAHNALTPQEKEVLDGMDKNATAYATEYKLAIPSIKDANGTNP